MSADWDETAELMRARIKAAGKFATNDPTPSTEDLGVINPRDAFASAPPYRFGMLPQLYEDYVTDKVANWGGDPAPYMVAFAAMNASVLHASVKVQTNPLEPENFRNPNDFALLVGKTGDNKSGMWRDLTKHQKDWQEAMSRAQASSVRQQPSVFMQNGSVEGMMMQIANNRGERLCVGAEEAMEFYSGAAAHKGENSVQAMSAAVCTVYDGGIYTKALVKKTVTIPEALATLIMVTVDENIAQWKEFNKLVQTGLLARHSFGVISNPQPRDGTKSVPGAGKRMSEMMIKLRGLKDVRLVLAEKAIPRWMAYVAKREDMNNEMALLRQSPGLVAYCRKYELRIFTLASIFQLYDFIEGGQLEFSPIEVPAAEHDDKVSGGMKVVKVIDISEDNLVAAVRFFEKFLIPSQNHFYKVASGMTEFGPELVTWLSARIINDDPNDPHGRELSRNNLTHRGPAALRGGSNEAMDEKRRRWVKALLDHGFIEPWEHPNQRPGAKFKADDEKPWYKLRSEVFEFFHDDESMAWLRAIDSKARMREDKLGPDGVLELDI